MNLSTFHWIFKTIVKEPVAELIVESVDHVE